MNTNFNPDLVDNDYIHQEDEFINPEYAKQIQEEKLKELQLIEALKQRQRMKQYPKGTDMYYEMQESQPSFNDFMRGYDPRFDPYGE